MCVETCPMCDSEGPFMQVKPDAKGRNVKCPECGERWKRI